MNIINTPDSSLNELRSQQNKSQERLESNQEKLNALELESDKLQTNIANIERMQRMQKNNFEELQTN